jgi:hypothetical protein
MEAFRQPARALSAKWNNTGQPFGKSLTGTGSIAAQEATDG